MAVSALAFVCGTVAHATDSINKLPKLDFEGTTGCYASSPKGEAKISGERNAILGHAKPIQGSQKANEDGLNGLLVFMSHAPYLSEQVASNSGLARIRTKIRKTIHNIPPPYGAKHNAGEQASIVLYSPEQSIPAKVGTADGSLLQTKLTEWRRFDGSCAREDWNFYFADKFLAKNGDIFIACLDQSGCVFKLSKLRQFKEFIIYQLIRPDQALPDFLFAVDTRLSSGDALSSLHILRSTANGWVSQYSHDGSGCEGGC